MVLVCLDRLPVLVATKVVELALAIFLGLEIGLVPIHERSVVIPTVSDLVCKV